MGFLVSPRINISEIDLSTVIPAVATTEGAFAGLFKWGPLNKRRLVASESKLVELFGKPDNSTYEHFFSAANYLAYSNKLHCVRVAKESQTEVTLTNKLTTTAASNVITVAHTSHGLSTGAVITISGSTGTLDTNITAAEINGRHTITVLTSGTYTFTVTNNGAAGVVSGGGALVFGTGDFALNSTTEKTTGSGTPGEGVLIKNEDHYDSSFLTGGGDAGLWAAKYPGSLGNSLKISLCPSASAYSQTLTGTLTTSGTTTVTGTSTVFTTQLVVGSILVHPTTGEERKVTAIASATSLTIASVFSTNLSTSTVVAKWEYYSEFGVAPGTSPYALARGCANDEVHIILLDEDGLFTGIRNQVLEKYAFVSLHGTAKTDQNDINYYKDVINEKSKYIYWLDKLTAGTNWGGVDDDVTFTNVIKNSTFSFSGGQDGNTLAVDADYERGFDLFKKASDADVSVIVSGPASAVLKEYIVQSICEVRKDCVACLSPNKASVVDNADDEVDDILSHFSSVSASSYAVVDSGWGYQYDRYNAVKRWIPLNGHIAGLMARVDTERDPWYSPAGIIYGHIKSVEKLAWNPDDVVNADALYLAGINPVISKAGQGVVLWGDKTYLNRPSAFDRINVRRLFIVLEKSIATATDVFLFQLNTPTTRARFVALVEPFLREVKGREGLTDFRVICDERNNTSEVIDRNEFRGDIYLKPTRSINYIQLNFIAVRTGAEFNEVVLGQSLTNL